MEKEIEVPKIKIELPEIDIQVPKIKIELPEIEDKEE